MICKVNSINLFYTKSGEGKPIILIHGNGESHEIFDELTEILNKKFCVYAVDSRCHGQSQITKSISYKEMAADIVGLIQKLNIEKPILYGFSDGGIIGLLIASKHPELISKLIISGANTEPKGIFLRYIIQLKLINFFKRDNLIKLMLKQPKINDEELKKIKVSTLITAGENDIIRKNHTENIAKQIENSVLKFVKNEDHGSYVVHSTKIYDVIKDFL